MTNSKHIAQLIGFADFPIRIRSVPHLHYFRIDHPPATALVQRLLPNVRITVVGDGGVPASSEAFHRMQDVKFGSVGEGGQRAWPIDVSADSATQCYEAGLGGDASVRMIQVNVQLKF